MALCIVSSPCTVTMLEPGPSGGMKPAPESVENTEKFRSVSTFCPRLTSVIQTSSSNSRNGSPIFLNTTRGTGSFSTSDGPSRRT